MKPRERVEVFQLLVLRQLVSQLQDRTTVALKGGGNLRFFFASPRFSEDLDFDVRHLSARTLRGKVDGILESPTLVRLLAAQGIAIEAWSAPKQTETVQRWKASIVAGASAPESTKLEFSRRTESESAIVDPVLPEVFERHRLAGPIVAAHYGIHDAARQKARALAGRAAPQARDVFDLNLLLDRGARLGSLPAAIRRAAVDRTLEFSYDEFDGQVLEFLEPDDRAAWSGKPAFEAMQERVADTLEGAT